MSLTVAGQPAKDRLMEAVVREHNFYGGECPSPHQVAIVLHALADHSAIMEMLQYNVDFKSPWPQATSIGRWFHALGHEMEEA